MKTIRILSLFLILLTSCETNKTHLAESGVGSFVHPTILNQLSNAPKQFTINTEKDSLLVVNDRGTTLHFSKSSFLDENNNIIKGDVTLEFQEYTNAAEIAFSGIPMKYTDEEDTYCFNSSGMFEIDGKHQSKQVKVNPDAPLSIDYALVQNIDSTEFYRLNDQGTNWELVQEIKQLDATDVVDSTSLINDTNLIEITYDEGTNVVEHAKYDNVKFRSLDMPNLTDIKQLLCYEVDLKKTEDYGIYQMTLSGYVNEYYKTFTTLVEPVFINSPQTKDARLKDLQRYEIDFEKAERLAQEKKALDKIEMEALAARVEAENKRFAMEEEKRLLRSLQQQQTERSFFNAGHFYPEIVRGLSIYSFGIYNCDQTYRMSEPYAFVNSTFYSTHKKPIENPIYVSVIDLAIVGAFSYNPKNFSIDLSSHSVLLLITDTGKMYLKEFKRPGSEHHFSPENNLIELDEYTSKIKSTKDLMNYLESIKEEFSV